MVRVLILFFFGSLASCGFLQSRVDGADAFVYRKLGRTFFSDPQIVGLKQIHLGRVGNLSGSVLVRGEVVEVNSLGTYLVLTQQNAKLIIDLSEFTLIREKFNKKSPKYLEVLGEIERGHKGLPFLRAVAFRKISQSEAH